MAGPPGLRAQGAGRLVSRFPERRVRETPIRGSDEEGVWRGPDSWVLGAARRGLCVRGGTPKSRGGGRWGPRVLALGQGAG